MEQLKKQERSFLVNVTREETRDTGMIIALICLVAGYYLRNDPLLVLAAVALFLNLLAGSVFKPIARVWMTFARLTGRMTSAIILSIVYGIMVVPVGVFRRLAGLDSLGLKQWKQGDRSVFKHRDHTFEPADLDQPY